ncbi:hypothetical protein [Acinetobacter seifertii]|uniref:hypothetical protein n=1 Tax=Acinetobacter seifertii TaxID=1530123 RepID=UPI003EE0BC85
MIDLKTKQAFWAEQLPAFKENYICLAQLDAVVFNNETGNFDALDKDATGFDREDILEAYHSVNTGWSMWLRAISQEKAKAQAVPNTHVLVEKSKISTWWQDEDEPENFASTEEQLLGLIAESEIYIDDMLIVEKHVQAQLSTQKLFCVYEITNKETGLAEIKFCESQSEAQEILNNNAKWVVEKEADQYESMNAFFEEQERKSGAEG